MKKSLATLALAGAMALSAKAQLVINTLNVASTIDFTGFTAPATWATATPGAGQLDSNTWAYTEGTRTQVAAAFGGNLTGGLGLSGGGVTTGGIYSFDVDNGPGVDRALGIQPTGSSPWAGPQSFTLRVQNNTGSVVSQLDLSYDIFVRNDQARANEVYFYWSLTNNGTAGSYVRINALDYTSPGAADTSPSWVQNARSTSITGLSLANGDYIYLRWGLNDSGGSGSRDEFAFDNISVTMVPEPGAFALLGAGLAALVIFRRRRQA